MRIKYVIGLLEPAAAMFSFGSGPTVLVCYVRVDFFSLVIANCLLSLSGWACVVEDMNLHMRPAHRCARGRDFGRAQTARDNVHSDA